MMKILDINKAIHIDAEDTALFTLEGTKYSFNSNFPDGLLYEGSRSGERSLSVSRIHYAIQSGISHKPETSTNMDIYKESFEPNTATKELVSLLMSVGKDAVYRDILFHVKEGKLKYPKYYKVEDGHLVKCYKKIDMKDIGKMKKNEICIYRGSTNSDLNNHISNHLKDHSKVPIRLVYYFKKAMGRSSFFWIIGYFIITRSVVEEDKYSVYLKYYVK